MRHLGQGATLAAAALIAAGGACLFCLVLWALAAAVLGG